MERSRKKTNRSTKKKYKSRYQRNKRKVLSTRYKGGNKLSNTIIIMMWMEGCQHCILLKETWLLLKNEFKFVTFIEMEARSIDNNLLNKYNIESPRGFPTLVKIKNGVVREEPTSRDINELRMWIKS